MSGASSEPTYTSCFWDRRFWPRKEPPAVRQEPRIVVVRLTARRVRPGDGDRIAGFSPDTQESSASREHDRPVAVPGSAAEIVWRGHSADRHRRQAVETDALELAAAAKRDRSAVRRPERRVGVVRVGHEPRGRRVERTDPQPDVARPWLARDERHVAAVGRDGHEARVRHRRHIDVESHVRGRDRTATLCSWPQHGAGEHRGDQQSARREPGAPEVPRSRFRLRNWRYAGRRATRGQAFRGPLELALEITRGLPAFVGILGEAPADQKVERRRQ